MPPRVIKRGAAAAGARRGGRVTRGALKSQSPLPESAGEDMGKTEEDSGPDALESKEEFRAADKCLGEVNSADEQKPADLLKEGLESEAKSNSNGMVPLKKEDEIKDSMDEYGKDERLDLDDNEAEYETEEYCGEEYEEREFEQEDVNEVSVVNEEAEEQEEEIEAKEEGGDLVGDEVVDGQEELDSEGDDEHTGEEVGNAETVDGEEEERRDVFQERRKVKEFEIFVGGLDKDVTEEELKKVFSQVGEVTEVRLMMNTQTKKNKGFAFLRFGTVEQAKRAVSELKNPVVIFCMLLHI